MNSDLNDKKNLILLKLTKIEAEASDISVRSKRLEHRANNLIRELERLELYSYHGFRPRDSIEVTNNYQDQKGLWGFVYDISARFVHFVDFHNRVKHCREPQNIKRIASLKTVSLIPDSAPKPKFVSPSPDSAPSSHSAQKDSSIWDFLRLHIS